MTTAHMLHLLISQWHHLAARGWRFPRRWHLAMRYLHHADHASRSYNRMFLRFLERHHYGPRTWKRWNQA